MSDPTPAAHVSVHRWAWRTEEVATMVALLPFGIAAGYPFGVTGLLTGLALAMVSLVWLYRVKVGRCDQSQVTITLTGSPETPVVHVESPGPLGQSRVHTARVEEVGYRRFHSDEVFTLAGEGTAARIPLRTTRDPKVRAVVMHAAAHAPRVTEEALDLYERMLAGQTPLGKVTYPTP